jgi:hypothetical protein
MKICNRILPLTRASQRIGQVVGSGRIPSGHRRERCREGVTQAPQRRPVRCLSKQVCSAAVRNNQCHLEVRKGSKLTGPPATSTTIRRSHSSGARGFRARRGLMPCERAASRIAGQHFSARSLGLVLDAIKAVRSCRWRCVGSAHRPPRPRLRPRYGDGCP